MKIFFNFCQIFSRIFFEKKSSFDLIVAGATICKPTGEPLRDEAADVLGKVDVVDARDALGEHEPLACVAINKSIRSASALIEFHYPPAPPPPSQPTNTLCSPFIKCFFRIFFETTPS